MIFYFFLGNFIFQNLIFPLNIKYLTLEHNNLKFQKIHKIFLKTIMILHLVLFKLARAYFAQIWVSIAFIIFNVWSHFIQIEFLWAFHWAKLCDAATELSYMCHENTIFHIFVLVVAFGLTAVLLVFDVGLLVAWDQHCRIQWIVCTFWTLLQIISFGIAIATHHLSTFPAHNSRYFY